MLKEKNKKAIGLMKNGLSWKIMAKFVRLRTKTYNHLSYDESEAEKAKSMKKLN